MWLLSQVDNDASRNRLVVGSAAVFFALVHLAQPGVSLATIGVHHVHGDALWLDRWRSGSTVPAALSHAAYNLALYAISGAILLRERASR